MINTLTQLAADRSFLLLLAIRMVCHCSLAICWSFHAFFSMLGNGSRLGVFSSCFSLKDDLSLLDNLEDYWSESLEQCQCASSRTYWFNPMPSIRQIKFSYWDFRRETLLLNRKSEVKSCSFLCLVLFQTETIFDQFIALTNKILSRGRVTSERFFLTILFAFQPANKFQGDETWFSTYAEEERERRVTR